MAKLDELTDSKVIMKQYLSILIILFTAASPCLEAQLAFPRDEQAPYLLVSPERLKMLVNALGTKAKIDLLLGPPAKELENGFHVYCLIPLRDLELFPGCVTGIRIQYKDNQINLVEIEEEALKRGIKQGIGMKYLGIIDMIQQLKAMEGQLEQEAMKNLNGPNSHEEPKVKD